jgi:hypothetical protein
LSHQERLECVLDWCGVCLRAKVWDKRERYAYENESKVRSLFVVRLIRLFGRRTVVSTYL